VGEAIIGLKRTFDWLAIKNSGSCNWVAIFLCKSIFTLDCGPLHGFLRAVLSQSVPNVSFGHIPYEANETEKRYCCQNGAESGVTKLHIVIWGKSSLVCPNFGE
jgi:hypothetical protein